MITSGNTALRANTNSPKKWQVLESDGITPVDITGSSDVILRLIKQTDGSILEFNFASGKMAITDAPNGEIEFSPALTDFTEPATYGMFIIIVDSSGNKKSVPEGKEYFFNVSSDTE